MSRTILKRGLLTVLIAVLLTPLVLLSAEVCDKKELFKDLHDQISNFKKTEIIPQMLDWKSKLDNSMEKADLDKLNELRAKAKEMKESMIADMKSYYEKMKDADKSDRKKGRKYLKKGRKMMKGQMKERMTELKPLAEKYEDVLEGIGEEAEVKKEEWQDAMEDLKEKWMEENEEKLEECKGEHKGKQSKGKRKGRHQMGNMMHGMMDFDRGRKAAFFMLWDGSTKENDFGFGSGPDALSGVDEVAGTDDSQTNFPNPFNDKTTIGFTLPESGNTKIIVVDNNGNTVHTIHEGFLEAGDHSYEFYPGPELPSGTYYYKIESDSFSKSGSMILNK